MQPQTQVQTVQVSSNILISENISMTKTRWIGNSELFKSTFEVTVRYNTFTQIFDLTPDCHRWHLPISKWTQTLHSTARRLLRNSVCTLLSLCFFYSYLRSNVTEPSELKIYSKDSFTWVSINHPRSKKKPFPFCSPTRQYRLSSFSAITCLLIQALQCQAYQHDRSITIWDRENSGFCPHNAQSRRFQSGQAPGKY